MKTTEDQIIFIKQIAYNCLLELQGSQDDLKRFLYCSFDKIYKCFDTVHLLYSQVERNENYEYSLGIILRSVLMNCIMIQHLRFIVLGLQPDQANFEDIEIQVRKAALKFIADGSDQLIKDLEFQETISGDLKKEYAEKISNIFPTVFKQEKDLLPKLNKGFKVDLKQLFKDSQHPKLISFKTIYRHYSYYSKYDHLSHWSTALSNEIDFQQRKKTLESSIAMIFINVRDLLFLGIGFVPQVSNIWYDRFLELDRFGSKMIVNNESLYSEPTA